MIQFVGCAAADRALEPTYEERPGDTNYQLSFGSLDQDGTKILRFAVQKVRTCYRVEHQVTENSRGERAQRDQIVDTHQCAGAVPAVNVQISIKASDGTGAYFFYTGQDGTFQATESDIRKAMFGLPSTNPDVLVPDIDVSVNHESSIHIPELSTLYRAWSRTAIHFANTFAPLLESDNGWGGLTSTVVMPGTELRVVQVGDFVDQKHIFSHVSFNSGGGLMLVEDIGTGQDAPPKGLAQPGVDDFAFFAGTNWCSKNVVGIYGSGDEDIKSKAFECLNIEIQHDPRFAALPDRDKKMATRGVRILRESKIKGPPPDAQHGVDNHFVVIAAIPKKLLVPHAPTPAEIAADQQAGRDIDQRLAMLKRNRCPEQFVRLRRGVCFRSLPTEVLNDFALASFEVLSSYSNLVGTIGLQVDGVVRCSEQQMMDIQPGTVARVRHPCIHITGLPEVKDSESFLIVTETTPRQQ